MSVPIDFARLPRQRVPRFVVSPRRILSDVLSKGWIEGAIPFIAFIALAVGVLIFSKGYVSAANARNLAQFAADGALVTLALLIVVAVGGIDLSVGSNFAMSAFVALYGFHILGLPVLVLLGASLGCGALIGAVNGALAGLLGCGALLTTIGMMITVRGLFTLASQAQLVQISISPRSDDLWDWIGAEKPLGIPVGFWVLAVVATLIFFMFRQSRFGWHILAVGGNRKAARHGGISVKLTVFFAYVIAGMIVGLSAFLFAAREDSIGADTGIGMEFFTLTALVVGLGGFVPGRGSVVSVLMGFATVYILGDVLINSGFRGDSTQFVLGLIIIVILGIDVKFRKNRHRLLASSYLDPIVFDTDVVQGMGGLMPDETAPKLARAELIALGKIDGPEDVALDADDNLYCGTRDGHIMRIAAPDYKDVSVLANTGGRPLGLTFDSEQRIVTCIAGMGLVRVTLDGKVELLTDQTERSLVSVQDDTTIRMADDLDIAPDGTIYFTDASRRFDIENWGLDLLEGRPNGRLLSFDPKTRKTRTVCNYLVFPNGVCLTHDGKYLLVASTWACSILIFDLANMSDGPRIFIRGLPGYPDNINRASDGGYWISLAGMRNPVMDEAMRIPATRRRMTRRVPPTNWLFGNLNIGGVLKADGAGRIVDALWDKPDGPLYMITSTCEHKGMLYLGGTTNNKIGRFALAGADREWTSPNSYWKKV